MWESGLGRARSAIPIGANCRADHRGLLGVPESIEAEPGYTIGLGRCLNSKLKDLMEGELNTRFRAELEMALEAEDLPLSAWESNRKSLLHFPCGDPFSHGSRHPRIAFGFQGE